MIQDLLARGLPDVDGRQPVTMPALELAIAVLKRKRHVHPRLPPPPAFPGETASRSRSMLSNPRMSFRVASGNDVHSSPSETVVSAVIRRGCPPRLPSPQIACPQPSGPLDHPEQALHADNRRAYIRLCKIHAL